MPIPISAQTTSPKLLTLFSIPFLGAVMMIFAAFLPPAAIAINLHQFYPVIREGFTGAGPAPLELAALGILSVFWNLFLVKKGTSIKLLWMPAWVIGLLFIAGGLAEYFQLFS